MDALIRTKNGELTLEQIADALPGTSEIMAQVGRRYARAYYAAHGGNWELAAYCLREIRSRQRMLAVIRPKYARQLAEFDREALAPLLATVEARDWEEFERAFAQGIRRANHYHSQTGKSYIRWKLPERITDDLDFGPATTDSDKSTARAAIPTRGERS